MIEETSKCALLFSNFLRQLATASSPFGNSESLRGHGPLLASTTFAHVRGVENWLGRPVEPDVLIEVQELRQMSGHRVIRRVIAPPSIATLHLLTKWKYAAGGRSVASFMR